MTEVIELKRLADLPTGHGMLSSSTLKTPQEAQAWAEKIGADKVYTFVQKTAGTMLAWVLIGEMKPDQEIPEAV